MVAIDNGLWHIAPTAPNSGWSSWQSLKGNLTADPVPVVNQDGRREVFARGSDNALWHILADGCKRPLVQL